MTTPEVSTENNPLEEVIGRLDPKTQKRVQFASEVKIEKIPLASRSLTHALNGGIARGRVFLVYGPQSAGKSVLAGQTVADAQDAGLVCAYGDAEGAYDPTFGARMGIDNSKLLYADFQAADKLTNWAVKMVTAGVDLLVIDSISDIISDAFLDKDGNINDFDGLKQIGAQAKAIRKLIDSIQYVNERTAVFLVSQTTTDLSGMYPIQVPHGGKKVLFKCSQIVKLVSPSQENRQIMGTVQDGDRLIQAPVARHVEAYVEKNKLGRQSTRAEYDLYYAGDYIGIDRFAEEVNLAVTIGAIEQRGAWYYFDDVKWQGEKQMVEALRSDEELMGKVNSRIRTITTGEIVE